MSSTPTAADDRRLANETTELLQACIRNACVNTGAPDSGQEVRSSDVIEQYLGTSGLTVQRVEPTPGRRTLVARLEGTDPTAPTMCWLAHTDVVPVNPAGWRHDPFGGEIIDGEVWGRGAIDMLNMTCSMAVATKELARSGNRPRGTIVYVAVADEEAGGHHGARHLVRDEMELVGTDYLITESGGLSLVGPRGHGVTITVGEKGTSWRRITVKGTPAHGSMPYGADNALVAAAEVVRRLAAYRPGAVINDVWRQYANALDVPDDVVAQLCDPSSFDDGLARIHDHGTAKFAHACTHTTFSPNVIHGGQKTNVIPDEVAIEVDIRTLPGQTKADVDVMLEAAIGHDLMHRVKVELINSSNSNASPIDTPLFDALNTVTKRFHPEAVLVPRITAGGTDATFFREAGVQCYGFGMFSRRIAPGEFASRFHGNDERIDLDSLHLHTQAWLALADLW
jgi:acetylornithine deacetylase/succinyl-diaminopimelate desuccinylase-like protein